LEGLGDKVSVESHVIADEDAVADGELERKTLVIRCPDANSRASFFSHLIISVDHPEELGFLYGELFFHDANASGLELAFEGYDEVIGRDWRLGTGSGRGLKSSEAFAVDILGTCVSD
jgi:hypothetical protein